MNSIAVASKKGRRVNGLFRLLTNPEVLWKHAYANIYSNKGAITKGVNENMLDGFSMERVNHLIGMLVNGLYCPKPVRRTYIPKKNRKLRPLGIPTGDDKLVQEVVRMLLEQIYEPRFSKDSHGFRPRKSCHTALEQIVKTWTGVKWIIEFDIKSFFDNINHQKLIELLAMKIDDKRIIDLIRKMLKAGYAEDWKWFPTWNGTPQGGVISPILANIYLHELDMFVKDKMADFNSGRCRKTNPEYRALTHQMRDINRTLQRLKEGWKRGLQPVRKELLQKRREIQEKMHKTPSKEHFDPDFRRLNYVRYADDFIIGVTGSRKDAELVMFQIKEFVEKELLLELAEEKTCIKRAKDGVRFLGYDLKVNSKPPRLRKLVVGKGTCVRRTTNEVMQLHVPAEKVYQYAAQKGYGDMARFRPVGRTHLLQRSDVEILLIYNAEIRGLANYYCLAQGYKQSIHKLIGIAGLSLFATLANKHHSTISKIMSQMRLPNQEGYGLRVIVNGKPTCYKLFTLKDHVLPKTSFSNVDKPLNIACFKNSRSELIRRLNANLCEYCYKKDGRMEVHHIRALKDVKDGKQEWQKIMIAMNRKTMILCETCHKMLHSRGLPDWKAKAR
jgi:RNA-directed DNA polymerase